MSDSENIYVSGKILKRDALAVAIVGTRTPTKYGRETAYKFAYALAKHKITIVSGLARGIDSVAHKAALDAGGRTIAVLGSGLDIIYPPENRDLAVKIAENGAVVTQFPNGTPPLGKNFLARNQLIAKLSRAILVVEGKTRSGTISTANHAANLGVEVFAIPGPINSHMSEAPLYLIEQGARIAHKPEDILEYLAAWYNT